MPKSQHIVLQKEHQDNLNAQLEWEFVFRNIGAQLPTVGRKGEPVWASCPRCSIKRSHVFRDRVFGGFWHFCHNCDEGADLIELAADVLNLPLEDAAARLLPRATSAEISDYILQYPLYRRKVKKFWSETYKFDPELDVLTKDLLVKRLIRLPPRGLWFERMGQYVAVVDPAALDHNLNAPVATDRNSRGRLYVSNSKINQWQDSRLLMAPCADLPGRIAGFYTEGYTNAWRRNHNKPVQTYWHVRPYPVVKDRSKLKLASRAFYRRTFIETGYAMDYTLYSGISEEMSRWCFVLLDVPLALQMQAQHMFTDPRPLPLAGAFTRLHRGPWTSWEAWRHHRRKLKVRRKYMFWAPPERREEACRMANIANASWSVYPVNHLTLTKPKIWLNELTEHKKRCGNRWRFS